MPDKQPKDTSSTTPLDPVIRKSLETGLITKGAISENNRPNTSVEESVNFDFDTIGAATLRKGTTLLGPTLNTATSTDTGMVYGTTYGKFNQGAGFTINPSAINFGTYTTMTAFSYVFWFKSSQSGAASNPYFITYGGLLPVSINKTTGAIIFTDNGTDLVSTVTGLADGNWHHVALTFNNGTVTMFVDASLQATVAGLHVYPPTPASLTLGSNFTTGGGNQFIGSMDDVALFSRVLTLLDVQALYAAELASTYLISDKKLVSYWQFEGNSNSYITQILGMHYYVDTLTAGANTHLVVVAGTQAYIWIDGITSSSWFSIRTGLTAGSQARFSTFLNYLFMVNGTEATAVWDGVQGDAFSVIGNALNAPTGQFIENFRSRMWIAGNSTYPDRLYYSSIPSSVVTPIVVWNTDVATGQWIDISPSDGETITGLQRFRNKMLVFKTNHIYRVFDIGQIDPDPWYPVGTYSAESIVESKTGVFFHHSSGFYQYNASDVVQEISRPIIDIIKAIPSSSYSSITGWLEPTGDHICWSVGNVTVRGVLYKNLVVRYTISTQTWTHRSYPTQSVNSLRRQPLFNDGNFQYALVGDTTGNVLKTNTGTTDNGAPIAYSIIHPWETIDGLLSTRKIVTSGNFSHYGGTGAEVAYQTEMQDPDDLGNWTNKVGALKEKNTGFNTINLKSRKIRFRIFGESTGQPFFYNGYELVGVLNEFLQFPN